MKSRYRTLTGPYKVLESIIAIVVPATGIVFITHLPMYLFKVSVFPQQYLAIFLGFLLGLEFLILPATKKLSKEKLPWYDLVLCFLSIAIGVYIGINYHSLLMTIGLITTFKTIMGTVFLLLILEGTRRLTGWMLVCVVVVFVLYYYFGNLLPGVLQISRISYGRMIAQLSLGADAVFGVALRTVVMIVFSFILFAQILTQTGGMKFIFNITTKVIGRYRGGSAKIDVIASTLFGLLTGSPVANVAATGPITIPMMKDDGYNPEYASAVNAVTGLGSCISPPILGAAAFIIAEFLRVPYTQVVIVSIVPAALLYFSLFMQSDLRAAKLKLKGRPPEGLPPMLQIIKSGWFFIIPLIILIAGIFFLNMRPETACFYATVSCILIGLTMKETRSNLKKVVTICMGTCRGFFDIAIICAAAGFIVGIMAYSGLSLTLIRIITDLAGNSILLLSIMAAVVSIILGMGMPVTASYLVMAILVVPAMTALGIPGIAAHMFVFYYAAFSFITPPVCVAVIAAASIGQANMIKTSLQACRFSIPAFIMPFLFIFNPAVALMGTTGEIVREITFSVIAVIAICLCLEGYFREKLNTVIRLLFLVVSIGLFIPLSPLVSFGLAALFVVLIVVSWIDGGRKLRISEGAA